MSSRKLPYNESRLLPSRSATNRAPSVAPGSTPLSAVPAAAGGPPADSVRSLTARSSHSPFAGDPCVRTLDPDGRMVAMTTLTRDRCPSCGAWLILLEVEYVAPASRRYPDIGNRVAYECPSCHGMYETWAHDADPLEEMTPLRRSLRDELAHRRPFEVS